MCFGGGGSSNGYAEQQRKDEEARQRRIREGMGLVDKNFKGFDDSFYRNRAQDYLNYANPQLAAQYGKAQENLTYNLARSGLTASSEAAKNAGELQRQYNLGRSEIEGNALNAANDARRNVEQNRSELIAQLQATSDPTATANQALARAGMLTQSQGFSPLGALFQNTTALLGNTGAFGYKGGNPFNSQNYGGSSSSPSTSASRVVR